LPGLGLSGRSAEGSVIRKDTCGSKALALGSEPFKVSDFRIKLAEKI